MEAVVRKPYQGVINIIRFNWHLYVAAFAFVVILLVASTLLNGLMFWTCILVAAGIILSTCISLFVSHYVYDRSSLYDFHWLQHFKIAKYGNIINIHAGFDETSSILKRSFPDTNLQVFDFYNAEKHTEVSIERARKAYPAYKGTVKITTSNLPITEKSADIIFNIFALHEIRDKNERVQFLREQKAALNDKGRIVVVEHLRDLSNFLAYNIGFFHFLAEAEWSNNFHQAGLNIERKFKIAYIISVFILKKRNGDTP